jgi:homocysteine S-methyltransferase
VPPHQCALCEPSLPRARGAHPLSLPPSPTAADYDAAGLITPQAYLRHAEAWVEAGATVVGGCCGVGPAHIAALAKQLCGKSPPLAARD